MLNSYKPRQIYDFFELPSSLQQHMLQTAALGLIICQNWQGENLDQELILASLLLHDLANLIKFDLNSNLSQSLLSSKHSLAYWQQRQNRFKNKYGKNTEKANIKIIRELKPKKLKRITSILKNHDLDGLQSLLKQKNWEQKIVLYSDLRITPQALASIEERLLDLRQRYQDRDSSWTDEKIFQIRLKNGLQLENQLNNLTQLNLTQLKTKDLIDLMQQVEQFPLQMQFNLKRTV